MLWPVSLLYCALAALRKWGYARGLLPVARFTQPIIAVGNITVGGTGKTPFTIWLVGFLQSRGLRPGVVSRGYGRADVSQTLAVNADSRAADVGDEPLMIARRTGVPVSVAKKRADAVSELLATTDCDVFICDDALQHYSIAADLSIALIDSAAGFGNGFCLPAGPLRERRSRLATVDLILYKGQGDGHEHSMRYEFSKAVNVRDNEVRKDLEFLRRRSMVNAIAGIANPDGFFEMLNSMNITFTQHAFPDHHRFTPGDFEIIDQSDIPLVMTEKDAVKCRDFARDNWWYIPIEAIVSEEFATVLSTQLSKLSESRL